MTITTPSGYVVTLAEKLTYGAIRELQKFLAKGVTMSAKDFKKLQKASNDKTDVALELLPSIDASKLLEYQEIAFPYLVKEITINGVRHTKDLFELVNDWEEVDGDPVYKAIDEIVGKYNVQKKIDQKPSATSSSSS